MIDKELANAVVALGVGHRIDLEQPHSGTAWVLFDDDIAFLTAESFITDWRVAGALMEKTANAEIYHDGEYVCMVTIPGTNKTNEVSNESLPRAIIEACVEALQK